MTDFFDREFQGCELNHNTPVDGCLMIRLNSEAHFSLSNFINDDRSLSARPFRQKEFNITFKREVRQRLPLNQQRYVHFINHLSPLIRWITKTNKDRAHSFFDVSAIRIEHPSLPPGDYCFRIERWKLRGLSNREMLAYGIGNLLEGSIYPEDKSEVIFQHLLRKGKDWDYVDCDKAALLRTHSVLEKDLAERFNTAVSDFEAENETAYQIKMQRVRSMFNRRIKQDEQRIRTLRESGRNIRMIRPAEGRLQAGIKNKEQRLRELGEKAKIDMEQAQVAAGLFRITNI